LRIAYRRAGRSLNEHNDVFQRTVRANEVGLIRQALTAIVLIFTDFDGRRLWGLINKLDLASNRSGKRLAKDQKRKDRD